MFIMFAGGCMLPLQAAINARLGRSMNNPIAASFTSFAVGFLVLAIYLVATKQFPTQFGFAKTQPLWIWTGGLIGACFVSLATALVPKLGATLSFTLIIAGQLVLSIIIDKYGLFGIAASAISIKKIIGIALVFLGVILIRNS